MLFSWPDRTQMHAHASEGMHTQARCARIRTHAHTHADTSAPMHARPCPRKREQMPGVAVAARIPPLLLPTQQQRTTRKGAARATMINIWRFGPAGSAGTSSVSTRTCAAAPRGRRRRPASRSCSSRSVCLSFAMIHYYCFNDTFNLIHDDLI